MEHYFSEKQSSELRVSKITQKIRKEHFDFYTAPGVFSKKKIDKGTLLLANNFSIKKVDSKILDIGCGIGILGIVCAKLFPETDILMTDINRRALKLAKMNLELNKLTNAKVKYSNLYEKLTEKFNIILSNPPQTAGKDICFKLIEESKKYLNTEGNLQLVARHNKGGKELEKKMQEVFGNVGEIAKKSGYRVYLSEKKA